jgi:hypothetical protein
MFQSIADIAGPQHGRRTHQPIRRHSRPKGRCEGVFWRRTNRQEVRQIVMAARRYELAGRQPGARNGPLGFVALEVLELLGNLVDFRSGRLDPSLDFLMTKLKRSRDAIVRALRALRDHGFLDWLRRFEPTENEGRGPQVRQVSNAYRLSLPRRAAALLGRLFASAPVPDDAAHRRQLAAAEIEAHRAGLSNRDRALFEVEDEGLAAALSRLGAALDAKKERESASRSESRSSFIS